MSLHAISPIDGRYHAVTASLQSFFSEGSLIQARYFVEVHYLQALLKLIPEGQSTGSLSVLKQTLSEEDLHAIKKAESLINHDVKAVEYFLRDQMLTDPKLASLVSFIHFGLTSEDINNLAYALLFKEALEKVIRPEMAKILDQLKSLSEAFRVTPMLARTHGQSATPTTLGKELAVFHLRLTRVYDSIKLIPHFGKLGGATGNWNAHAVAYPDIDWPGFSQQFVESLGLSWNSLTTQIEPHDGIAELSHAFIRFNTISLDLARDIWGYISLGYLGQKAKAEDVGSSTMPHKVNPIDFENAEGNLGLANALFTHFAEKLPVSRFQRDLSDSTVMRSIGSAWAYNLIAYQSLQKGLSKITVQPEKLLADLNAHPEILAEAIQTVLRKHQKEAPYEALKALTRGKSIQLQDLHQFIDSLDLPIMAKAQLKTLKPEDYLGYASAFPTV